MQIHEEIAEFRGKAALSFRQLARKSGVDHARIAKIEHGTIKPGHRDVIRLAHGLEVPEEVRERWLKALEKNILAG